MATHEEADEILRALLRARYVRYEDVAKAFGMSVPALHTFLGKDNDPRRVQTFLSALAERRATGDANLEDGLVTAGMFQLQLADPHMRSARPEELEAILSVLFLGAGPGTWSKRSDEARDAMNRLMRELDLTWEQVAVILESTTQEVAVWLEGRGKIPLRVIAMLGKVIDALNRLDALFEPGRIPGVIRRPAELFNNRTALDVILAGGISDVADHYERALTYSQ